MAKSYYQKARKEYKCSKCGKVINPGDHYYKIEEMYRATRYRCEHCKPERSELTGSEYYSWLWDLQDHLEERYDLRSEECKDELYSELENVRDELQDKWDNIPESLQYSPNAEMIQERIDSLDDAMNELDNLEYPEKDEDAEDDSEYEDKLDEWEQDLTNAIQNIE